MNIEDLPQHLRFAFIAIMKAALSLHNQSIPKDMYLQFCEGIWETIEMNDINDLKETIDEFMTNELKNIYEDIKK